MYSLLVNRVTAVWLVLMLATIASTWWLTKDMVTVHVATSLVVIISAIKIRLVMLHFMELEHAPLGWRIWFECWISIVAAAILLSYFNLTPW